MFWNKMTCHLSWGLVWQICMFRRERTLGNERKEEEGGGGRRGGKGKEGSFLAAKRDYKIKVFTHSTNTS